LHELESWILVLPSIFSGTTWSAVAHIITAVIGSGVLSLAWSTAQLGWVGGPLALLCFAIITYVSSSLLSDCYRTPDPVTGKRNYSYMDAVRVNLGTEFWFSYAITVFRLFIIVLITYHCIFVLVQVKQGHGLLVSFNFWPCMGLVVLMYLPQQIV